VKEDIVKDIVEYLEHVYDSDLERFVMVPKEVEKYPHAIWWMHKDILKNFPFGNPDPEVIGFLYQNKQYLKSLNINGLMNKVIDFIKSEDFKKSTMHTILSVAKFYKRVDSDVQNLIKNEIIYVIDKELELASTKWDEYSFEPYKIYILDKFLCTNKLKLLNENLLYNLRKVENLSVEVPWKWYIYDDEFEAVKNDWLGALYFGMIKALRLHRTF
jgi:hypothetical protein